MPLKCPKCGSRNTVTETAGNIAKVTRDDRFLTSTSGYISPEQLPELLKEGANKQVISSQADSLIKISRIWADFFPANTSNQPI